MRGEAVEITNPYHDREGQRGTVVREYDQFVDIRLRVRSDGSPVVVTGVNKDSVERVK